MKSTSLPPVGVLVVDDDTEVLGYLVSILETSGYESHRAHSSAEALQVLKDCPAGRLPAIAIVDLVLGDENGMKTAEDLVRVQPALKVLMISGYADTVVSTPFANGAPASFLTKPFTAGQLREALVKLGPPVA